LYGEVGAHGTDGADGENGAGEMDEAYGADGGLEAKAVGLMERLVHVMQTGHLA